MHVHGTTTSTRVRRAGAWVRRALGVVVASAPFAVSAQSSVTPAAATTLARVRSAGMVRCGAVARPGLAQRDGSGPWTGILVDLCGAIATAALGAPPRIEFRGYAADADFERIRQGRDDVFFLTGGEINAHALAGDVNPGPTVFLARNAVMVPADAPERHLADLAGKGICYLIADAAERSLEDYFDTRGLPWLRHAYSEDGEMLDAYAAQRCHAMAGEATWLAARREARGRAPGRLLPEALERFPVVAATGVADGRWSAVVAWTVNTVVNAERPETKWFAGGASAMPLAAPELGLAPGWQAAVIAATGHYGAICSRHLGPATPFNLERQDGDALLLPFAE